jgi:hypothetical protein
MFIKRALALVTVAALATSTFALEVKPREVS